MEKGRLKVLLKFKGQPENPEIPNSSCCSFHFFCSRFIALLEKVLLVKLADYIKRLPKRSGGGPAAMAATAAAAADPAPGSPVATGGGRKKGKNRK